MTVQAWIDWCQKQLSDLSRRLFQQGYSPSRIEELNQESPEFRKQFEDAMTRLNQIMADMATNPEGYHHFDDFTKAKMALLQYTNYNREQFLHSQLAQTA